MLFRSVIGIISTWNIRNYRYVGDVSVIIADDASFHASCTSWIANAQYLIHPDNSIAIDTSPTYL